MEIKINNRLITNINNFDIEKNYRLKRNKFLVI